MLLCLRLSLIFSFCLVATKEVAYVNSIISASVTLHLAKSCLGKDSHICRKTQRDPNYQMYLVTQNKRKGLTHETVEFSEWITEYFFDYVEQTWGTNIKRITVNKHNNNIGRKVSAHLQFVPTWQYNT